MSSSEKRNHPGHLSALPTRTRLTRTPSPLGAHASTSSLHHNLPSSNKTSLAQRSNHNHAQSHPFSANAGQPGYSEAFGTTPNYELPADGMFSAADTSSSYWLPQGRPQSVPPNALPDAHPRRQPPRIDTSAKPYSRRSSLMEDSEKRPTSPHITSATPTMARHHHSFAPNHMQRSASGPAHDHDPSQRIRHDKSPSGHRVASPSLLQMGIGRAAVSAAQSIMDAVAGRASPVLTRNRSIVKDRDSLSDDEAGKGHGRKAAGTGRYTPTSQHREPRANNQTHRAQFGAFPDKSSQSQFVAEPDEIIEGFSGNVEWRASISESRRATPAAYRPRPTTPSRKRGSGQKDAQVPYSDDSTDVRLPGSHHSTHSSILIGSPIVIPQARRGAIRLRPRRRRRVSKQLKPQLSFRQKLLVFAASLINLIRLLASPVEAAHRLREWVIDTKIWIDESFRDPNTGQRSFYPPWLQAYVPLLIWLGISLSSTALVITFHTEVFIGLDHLATYLQGLGTTGKFMLGSLIFLTTFPPLPLYSTLIMLCGFTFGLWQGFIISYIAALSGAIVVFTLSRSLLKDWMVGLLNKSGGLKKVVRAIEKQPKLLFLVRLAPYPYNLMNTLLASSPTLTLKTYVTCTALALPKLLIHTGLGTSIKNFAAYNGASKEMSKEEAQASQTAESVKKWAGLVGIGLCIGIMIYLLSVARKAVDELDDEDDVIDGEDQDLLSSSDMDDDEMEDTYLHDNGSGVDMRERAGPATLGFRNGYAPIDSSPEERFRQSMRQPAPMGMSVSSFDRASGSFEDRISHSNHSGSVGGHSIDLAEKIAEMEAHAEEMQFGTPLQQITPQETTFANRPQGSQSMTAFGTPHWGPMALGVSDDDADRANFEPSAQLQQPAEIMQHPGHNTSVRRQSDDGHL